MAITQIKSTGIANGAVTSNNLGTLSNISVSGTSNLGNVANVTITGGSVGQVLTTNGSGTLSWATPAATGPTITQIQITDSSYNVLDDTAVSTGGGYIKITGTGFSAGAIVVVGNINATSTTFVSSTVLNVQVPSAVAGTYTIYVVNTNGSTAIGVNGLTYSGTPTWVTGSTLPNGLSGSPINIQLSATGDAPLTYALAAGNTLPSGLTLTSGGLLSGTVTVGAQTVYAFTINAIDAEAQDSPRAFTITITVGDPYFYLTTLLLPGNGTNNGTNNTFIDGSTNNFTITRNGNTTQGTFTPFSLTGWSTYFDGSGDRITIANSSALDIVGDFCQEAWVFPISGGQNFQIIGYKDVNGYIYMAMYNNKWSINSHYSGEIIQGPNIIYNTWTHVALTRQGSTIRLFINGVLQGTTTNNTNYSGNASFIIGYTGDNNWSTYAYISNFRITKSAVPTLYQTSSTTNGTTIFTPSTSNLTTTSQGATNTSLLIFQNNRFIDNSVNALVLSVNSGTPSIQSFSPFAPGAAYSTSTVGGSAYFDGTGDSLTIPSNAAFTLGSSTNFTIECYVYLNGSQAAASIIFSSYGDWNSSYNNMYALTANGNTVGWFSDSGNYAISSNVNLYCWNHIAIVRNSSTITMYINGVSVGTQTTGQNYTTANSVKFGSLPSSGVLNGYISNFRLVNGSAVYTSNFTPPAAPLTNITNTSLLCNFTNGQITDATSKNDFETAGNSTISTTQSKWGGSSMYFDGNDYLVAPSSQNFALGTGDYTIEAWVYPTSIRNGENLVYVTDVTGGVAFGYNQTQIYIGARGVTFDLQVTYSMSTNTWTHIAAARQNGTVRIFANGNLVGSGSVTRSCPQGIGGVGDYPTLTGNGVTGYINDLRLTKGYARYTTTFTPPTGAFPTL